MRVFVSHSRRDKELVYKMSKVLYRCGVQPFIAEFEELGEEGRFTSEEIKREIANSNILVLFLTPNVSLTPHTRSWVVYEASVAHAMNKPVYVFEDERNPVKDLPIPHVDCYWLYDPELGEDWRKIEEEFKKMKEAEMLPLESSIVGLLIGRLLGLPPLLGGLAGFVYGYSRAEELRSRPPQDLAKVKTRCYRCMSMYYVVARVQRLREGFLCPVCRVSLELES